MSLLPILKLSDLPLQEKQNIVCRKSLDLTDILNDVVHPVGNDLKNDTRKKLLEYSGKWDRCRPDPLVVTKQEMKDSYASMLDTKYDAIKSFEEAKVNITLFHERQKPQNIETTISKNKLGMKFVPFDKVALYVPGGKALYPSTVLMGVIPAKIAGVRDITIISPPNPQTGKVPEIVKAIAHISGADRIVQAGGAQAVIAMAYGIPEENIAPVDYIFGPGNKYVAAAKNYVFSNNLCGIDSFAGPSEVLIIADHTANPWYLAHDLMAQAEHDEDASAILLCTSEKIAGETVLFMEKALSGRKERETITRNSIQKNGKILIVPSLDEAIEFSNEYAPEHLEIQTEKDDFVLEQITAAGSIFCGPYAPVAIGDYFSGTNHILPTNRAARFASGVSVHSFFRRITYQTVSREGLDLSRIPITHMSKEEGLFDEHGYSVLARFE
ncbi:MAG: histidinol dehydrogenase [Spirochaetia bacterium]|nr:histidinol dehydrogenase [Spirochaetia bacterium]